MKALRSCRRKKYRPFWIRVTLFTFATMFLSSGVLAEDVPQKKGTNQADEQIQIVADKLITNSAEKYADFIRPNLDSYVNSHLSDTYSDLYATTFNKVKWMKAETL